MRLFLLLPPMLMSFSLAAAQDVSRPNILWITSEDNGPHLGAYGDTYARTPHLDALAERGLTYENAWSTAPVCAPARTALIMGMFPSSTGGQHMRSEARLPEGLRMYPQLLREAGYYCTNNSKEDYNLEKPGRVWDESSPQAHWRNRPPGRPFFAVFNHTISHESQIRARPHRLRSDPARVRVPAYHPDTPEVRHDWAQYYDKLEEMDALAGENLRELEEAGLAEDTIVFYYSDHGSGMPRSKRWLYNSGLHVPLIVYVPEKFRRLAPSEYTPGGRTDRLVGFVDLAPTLLSLIGVRPPEYLQGHAFMGEFEAPPRDFLFGVRDRMDERIDLLRAVRDKRYLYIRNYMPHRIYGQYLDYMFQTPTTRIWRELYDRGELSPPQTFFWEEKPPEELYDLENDPDEVRNLAGSPEHHEILNRLRRALRDFVLSTGDLGFLPESEMHARAAGSTPYELSRDRDRYPLQHILETAELAASKDPEALPILRQRLRDEDGAVRYWAVLGHRIRGASAVETSRSALLRALEDEVPSVRIASAEVVGLFGTDAEAERATSLLIDLAHLPRNGLYVSIEALNALDQTKHRAPDKLALLRDLPTETESIPGRLRGYVPRLLNRIVEQLEAGRAEVTGSSPSASELAGTRR